MPKRKPAPIKARSAHATPAMLELRHASVGTSSLNQIASSSRLILPACPTLRDQEADGPHHDITAFGGGDAGGAG